MCRVDLQLSSLMHWVWDSRKQTNSFLHSHAKAIISLSLKVLHLFCWFWDSKLLLSLRTYKIILPNIIYSLFPMHSFCTLLNSKNSLSDERNAQLSYFIFLQFSRGTCPYILFPFPPLIGDAHEILLFASKWTWEL